MKTLYHPNLRDTAIEVADADVDRYVAQGWRKTKRREKKQRTVSEQPDLFSASAEEDSDSSTSTGEDTTNKEVT